MRISKKNILSQTTALMGFRISGCNIISPQQALKLITRTYSHPTLEILLRHLQNKKKVSKQRKYQKYVFAKKSWPTSSQWAKETWHSLHAFFTKISLNIFFVQISYNSKLHFFTNQFVCSSLGKKSVVRILKNACFDAQTECTKQS